jgi:hypothetical protein
MSNNFSIVQQGVSSLSVNLPAIKGIKYVINRIMASSGDLPLKVSLRIGNDYKFFGFTNPGVPLGEPINEMSGDGKEVVLFVEASLPNLGSIAGTIQYESLTQ